MKISLSWLKDFVELPHIPAEKLADEITRHTAEVEGVIDAEKDYENMLVGKILSIKKHPGADRLTIAMVNIGKKDPVQIVCGGQNLYKDMLVAVALPGAKVKWHGEGDPVTLEPAVIRGESSFGMICAGEEIGLESDNPKGATEVRICDLTALRVPARTSLAKALGKDGAVLEIDNKSLTHRPDLWSHYGFAREISAIYGKPLKPFDRFLATTSGQKSVHAHGTATPGHGKSKVKIEILDAKICTRFSACIVSGIKIAPSPSWLRARLESAGMNSHNFIVDITNYVMLELGEPMHAYDRKIVGDDALRIRSARKGEKLLTLEGGEHILHPEDPLVCDGHDHPLGIAGIKGGLNSGITDTTTEIILEAANFDPFVVRKSAIRNNLRTDSAQRFEKSLDPELTEIAIERALTLIKQICPTAKLEGPICTAGTWKKKSLKVTISPANICNKIGLEIPKKEIVRILKALGFGIAARGENLEITVPSHRATKDVSIEEDIVEEVARIYGYDKIPAILPLQPIRLPIENVERQAKHCMRGIMAHSLGFTEVVTYSFYGEDRFKKCAIPEKDHIKVLNFLSLDQTHMRISLTPNLLAVVAQNCRENNEIKIFEFGRTYREVGAFMPLEEKRLTAVIAQKSEPFYAAKGAAESLLKAYGITHYELNKTVDPLPYAHPNKSVDVIINDKIIGSIFVVHPAVAAAFDINLQVGIFTINFTELIRLGREPKKFTAIPRFPGMSFDVSVLVDKNRGALAIESIIKAADPKNIMQTVSLFDIYEGKNIPEDKKSFSFNILLRHPNRTLTETELQETQKAVFLALEAAGGKIRRS